MHQDHKILDVGVEKESVCNFMVFIAEEKVHRNKKLANRNYFIKFSQMLSINQQSFNHVSNLLMCL